MYPKIDDYEDIHSVSPLYLMIGKVIGHIAEKNGSKYLVFVFGYIYLVFGSADENKKVLKNAKNFRIGLKMRLRQLIAVEQENLVKISWKLILTLMIIFVIK